MHEEGAYESVLIDFFTGDGFPGIHVEGSMMHEKGVDDACRGLINTFNPADSQGWGDYDACEGGVYDA